MFDLRYDDGVRSTLLSIGGIGHDTRVSGRRGLSTLRLWEAVVAAAASLGATPLPRPTALATGSRRLHTAFAAAVFRAHHGLQADPASVEAMRAEALAVRPEPYILPIRPKP